MNCSRFSRPRSLKDPLCPEEEICPGTECNATQRSLNLRRSTSWLPCGRFREYFRIGISTTPSNVHTYSLLGPESPLEFRSAPASAIERQKFHSARRRTHGLCRPKNLNDVELPLYCRLGGVNIPVLYNRCMRPGSLRGAVLVCKCGVQQGQKKLLLLRTTSIFLKIPLHENQRSWPPPASPLLLLHRRRSFFELFEELIPYSPHHRVSTSRPVRRFPRQSSSCRHRRQRFPSLMLSDPRPSSRGTADPKAQ